MKLWIAEFADKKYNVKTKIKTEIFYEKSKEIVRQNLIENGYYPIWIKPYEIKEKRSLQGVGEKSATLLNSLQFAAMDTSPALALNNTIQSEKNPKMRAELIPAKKVLDSGGSMTESLKALKWYSPDTLAIIEVGERTGNIKMAAEYASERLHFNSKRNKHNIFLLTYIAFQLFIITTAKLWMLFKFRPFIDSLGIKASNPEMQLKFDETIDAVLTVNLVMLIIAGIIICFGPVFLATVYMNKNNPVHWSKRFFNRIPGWKGYMEDMDVAASGRIISKLLEEDKERKAPRGSVPEAVEIAQKASGTDVMFNFWKSVSKKLSHSEPKDAFCAKPFKIAEQNKIKSTTTIGHLADIMVKISEKREMDAEVKYNRIRKWITIVSITYEFLAVLVMVWGLKILMQGAEISQQALRDGAFGG